MAQIEAAALPSAQPYPSPPTSPRPAKASTGSLARKDATTTSPTSTTTSSVPNAAKDPDCKEPLGARPVTPTEPTSSDDPVRQRATRALDLDKWKRALCIDSGKCGANTQKDTPCKNPTPKQKAMNMNGAVELLMSTALNNVPTEIETQLYQLAKIVHCTKHDDDKAVEARVDRWLPVLPVDENGPPRRQSLERRLRCILGSAPVSCTSLKKCGQAACRNKMSKAKMYDYNRTLDKMIKLATAPSADADDDVPELVEVLRYNMLCHTHNSQPYKQQREWIIRINKFRAACQNEIRCWRSRAAATMDATKATQASKGVVGDSMQGPAIISPPPTPKAQRTNRNPADYWKAGFDTSPFEVLGKGDPTDDGESSQEAIWRIVRSPLRASGKKGEDEVSSGTVYVYTSPGNEGFVKIGFTTRSADARHEEWEKDCNREIKPLYPDLVDTGTVGCVPHAHRVERLVHAELLSSRVRIYCKRCQKQHREWFEVSKDEAIAVVKKWSSWIAGRPYGGKKPDGKLAWCLKAVERNKLTDVGAFLKRLEEGSRNVEVEVA